MHVILIRGVSLGEKHYSQKVRPRKNIEQFGFDFFFKEKKSIEHVKAANKLAQKHNICTQDFNSMPIDTLSRFITRHWTI